MDETQHIVFLPRFLKAQIVGPFQTCKLYSMLEFITPLFCMLKMKLEAKRFMMVINRGADCGLSGHWEKKLRRLGN